MPATPSEGHRSSIEELEKSIEATLAQYRSSFDASASHNENDTSQEKDSSISHQEFRSRLNSFRPDTYFAKPVCLSPLNCAAMGWQNTEQDIIQCPQCNSVICIAFHPNLSKKSHDDLTQQYLKMLATSHEDNCSFRRYAGRWLKIMERLGKQKSPLDSAKHADLTSGYPKDHLVFVPPYFLSLSSSFLIFEDASNDGSVTYSKIKEESAVVLQGLPKSAEFELSIPDAMKDFCEVPASIKRSRIQTANLLATFGWHIRTCDEGCVECKMCLAKSILPSRKRSREGVRVDGELHEMKLHLIDSHRVYCPYVAGFSFAPSHESQAGWKVVVKNLVKFAMKDKDEGTLIELDELWGRETRRTK